MTSSAYLDGYYEEIHYDIHHHIHYRAVAEDVMSQCLLHEDSSVNLFLVLVIGPVTPSPGLRMWFTEPWVIGLTSPFSCWAIAETLEGKTSKLFSQEPPFAEYEWHPSLESGLRTFGSLPPRGGCVRAASVVMIWIKVTPCPQEGCWLPKSGGAGRGKLLSDRTHRNPHCAQVPSGWWKAD